MEISAREILKEHKKKIDNINKLEKEFGKCVKNFKKARIDIKNCVQKALERGLGKKEIKFVLDRYFSEECEICKMIIFAEIMNHEFEHKNEIC